MEPAFIAEGIGAATGQGAQAAGCAPATAPPMQPGKGESKNVLLVAWHTVLDSDAASPRWA
jgi:hypothetical protein